MPDQPSPAIIPGMPYTVVEMQFGPHMRPTRLYPSGRYGDILTDDEIAVWNVVRETAVNRVQAQELTSIDSSLTAAFREYIGEAPAEKPKRSRKAS